MTKKFRFNVELVDDEVDDVMTSALQGIMYWCDDVKVYKNDPKGAEFMSGVISRGGTLRLHDEEENKWHTLNLQKFAKGVFLSGKMDLTEYDMIDADVAIQFAVFGEVVYG